MAINVKVTVQIGKSAAAIKSLSKALKDIKAATDAINTALSKTATLANTAAIALSNMRGNWRGGVNSRSGGGSTPRGGGASSKPPISDPYQAYANRRNQNSAFAARYKSQNGKPPPNPFVNALMRSRVSQTGQVMPLVMDLVKLIPLELLPAVAAAAIAIKVFSKVVTDASSYLAGLRGSQVMGGGSQGVARAANRASDFLGIDVGGIGKGLMGGFGPVAAAGAGVNPLGGPFGNNNYNQKGLAILDYIRKASSFDQARRRAELANAPEAASVYLLGNQTYKRLTSTTANGGAPTKAQAEMQANLATLSDNLGRLEAALAGPVIKRLSTLFGSLADLLGQRDSEHAQAIRRNTKELSDMNRLLSQNQGDFGGGPRVQGANTAASKQTGYFGSGNGMVPYGMM